MIYFDHNATTPLDERVLAAMLPFLQTFYGNPSALYRIGRIARSAIESARAQVAALVSVQPEQVIFTSGGTEANNLALHQLSEHRKLLISALEHPSILEPAQQRQFRGTDLLVADVDSAGLLDATLLQNTPWNPSDLVSLQLANNETGVIQTISDHAASLRLQQVIVHSDATQAAGKIPLIFKELQVNMLSLSSHKLYGPKGCGALIIEPDFKLKPLLLGGGQEHGARSGTENVANIVGFGKAAELALIEQAQRQEYVVTLRTQLEQALKTIPGVVIFSEKAPRLPNTVQLGKPGLDGEMLLMQLDRHGIAVSSGSACASGGGKPSAILKAMGVEDSLAKSAIRVSLGHTNTAEEITTFISHIKKLIP